MAAPDHLRILDAALNRATEGLRVVEDYARFVLDDDHASRQLKELRHELAAAAETIPAVDRHAMRDTPGDVGTTITTASETQRADAWQVCRASCERVKQSLRSLEEFGKCTNGDFAARCESLRYRFYAIEAVLTRTSDAAGRLAAARLYVLVDGQSSESEFVALVKTLVVAGAEVIQLRDKRLADAELLARARRLCELCAERAMAIVNDRPDIAAAAGADGVHLGQDDMAPADARRILGPRKLIGVSTHAIEQARAAVLAGANYLGAGPTFPSATKSFDEFPGLDYLRQVASEIALPAFAIGGINATNVDSVLATGVRRVAVSSAVTAAASPGEAVRELRERLAAAPQET
ncbi:MAG: thiamine phosphate synthase [Planctomycetales bacterium]|nr:thiamine phosphate synthase [Planctomycetales bacterium]